MGAVKLYLSLFDSLPNVMHNRDLENLSVFLKTERVFDVCADCQKRTPLERGGLTLAGKKVIFFGYEHLVR